MSKLVYSGLGLKWEDDFRKLARRYPDHECRTVHLIHRGGEPGMTIAPIFDKPVARGGEHVGVAMVEYSRSTTRLVAFSFGAPPSYAVNEEEPAPAKA